MTTRRRTKAEAADGATEAASPTEGHAGPRHDVTEAERQSGFDRRLAETVPVSRRVVRSNAPRTVVAELTRGLNYRLCYTPSALVFFNGTKVPITDEEFQHLSRTALDKVTYSDLGPDGEGRVRRHVHKFVFYDAESGEPLDVPVPPDEVLADLVTDEFELAMRRRRGARGARAST